MPTLTPEQIEQFGSELEQLRQQTQAKVGAEDARYIRRVVAIQRCLDWGGRIVMVLGFFHPVLWILGILMLAASKILDNMEIGHNVMHGQYDFMNDPHINSRRYEWDNAGDCDSWRRYHNYEHHTYTNVIGKDRDFGYGLLRLSDDLAWRPKNTWQMFTYINLSLLFEWGVAYHELAAERIFIGKPRKDSTLPISRKALRNAFFRKAGRQIFKDYIFFPLLCWPVALQVLLGNLIANLLRNLWTATIIFCGHFTENIHTFREEDIKNETRAQWYYRQILGSSNIQGNKLFHILTGHLSCQIEHHLFPDIPAPRYRDMAPQVQAICARYGIPYNTGRFSKQYGSVVKRIWRYSFPTTRHTAGASAS
ncbi:MAG: acyl-CoA desaturase [Oleiphilaceae bacterium]|nr:acyl-CoA desaturase [Oleiphilaceae bacterium]